MPNDIIQNYLATRTLNAANPGPKNFVLTISFDTNLPANQSLFEPPVQVLDSNTAAGSQATFTYRIIDQPRDSNAYGSTDPVTLQSSVGTDCVLKIENSNGNVKETESMNTSHTEIEL